MDNRGKDLHSWSLFTVEFSPSCPTSIQKTVWKVNFSYTFSNLQLGQKIQNIRDCELPQQERSRQRKSLRTTKIAALKSASSAVELIWSTLCNGWNAISFASSNLIFCRCLKKRLDLMLTNFCNDWSINNERFEPLCNDRFFEPPCIWHNRHMHLSFVTVDLIHKIPVFLICNWLSVYQDFSRTPCEWL